MLGKGFAMKYWCFRCFYHPSSANTSIAVALHNLLVEVLQLCKETSVGRTALLQNITVSYYFTFRETMIARVV